MTDKLEINQFMTLERHGEEFVVPKEGVQYALDAMKQNLAQLETQAKEIERRRLIAQDQVQQYERFLGLAPAKKKRGRPRKAANGAAKQEG